MDGSQLGTVHADLSSISTYPVPGLEPRRRKSMTRITKKAVDALSAREREYMLWDRDIRGFGVRVHPSGRKVYLVKYRHHGRVIKKTIGPHGTIPPAAARARAAETHHGRQDRPGLDRPGRATRRGRCGDHARSRQAVPGGLCPDPPASQAPRTATESRSGSMC